MGDTLQNEARVKIVHADGGVGFGGIRVNSDLDGGPLPGFDIYAGGTDLCHCPLDRRQARRQPDGHLEHLLVVELTGVPISRGFSTTYDLEVRLYF